MDIQSLAGDRPADMPVEGPSARQVLAYLETLDLTGMDSQVEVLAVVAVQVARALDRSTQTGIAASVIPNLSRQLRETLADIRTLASASMSADDPMVALSKQLRTDAGVPVEGPVTPSLFAPGPGA